jgi:hypothetical protein
MIDSLGKACALCNELKVGLACLSEQCARPVHVDCRWSKTPYGCNIEHARCYDSSKDDSVFAGKAYDIRRLNDVGSCQIVTRKHQKRHENTHIGVSHEFCYCR